MASVTVVPDQLDQHLFFEDGILNEFAAIRFLEQEFLPCKKIDAFLRSLALPARASVDYISRSARHSALLGVCIEGVIHPAEVGIGAVSIGHALTVYQKADCVIRLFAG